MRTSATRSPTTSGTAATSIGPERPSTKPASAPSVSFGWSTTIGDRRDWLTSRFPDAELRDVQGLVKVVDRTEIAANDWRLTPVRYVGVAPEEEDEDFNFREAIRGIHAELEELNDESVELAAAIRTNFEALGV